MPIYVSLEKLDKRLLDASADLGADPRRTFWQVTLPLSLPGVATGSMLVFILLMGEYILPQFLGGGKVFFIGNALVDLFLQSRNWPFGAAVSIGHGRHHVRHHRTLHALRVEPRRCAPRRLGVAMRIYAALIYVFLYAPIALIVFFSFNAGTLCDGLAGLLRRMVRQGLHQSDPDQVAGDEPHRRGLDRASSPRWSARSARSASSGCGAGCASSSMR